MKMSDILRDLADLIDQKQGSEIGSKIAQRQLEPVEPAETELDDNPVMIPPLQQKIELLKKSVGVKNEFDDAEESTDSDQDEIGRMKKMAGIMVSSEDNDVLG